jgi:PKD repeat protein
MSDSIVLQKPDGSASRSRRGQSLVEFALLLPLLIVLLLGIADFGRIFAVGITLEAAARNAAEIVAQEYLRNPPGPMTDPAPTPGDDDFYRTLHELAARTACRETKGLSGVTYTPDDPGVPGNDESCGPMPIIRTCIHDEVDTRCGQIAFGHPAPADCPAVQAPMIPTMEGGTEESRYVEVRICYEFTTIVNMQDLQLPLSSGISVGDIWLEKDRVFGVGFYPPPPTPEPPPPPPPPPPTPAPCSVPIASFTADPLSGTSPLNVQFTETATEVDCPILSWSWDFGDGSPVSTDQDPAHTFTYADSDPSVSYTVTLTVTSDAGPHQASRVITVGSSAPCQAPVASLTANPGSGPSPLEVQFTDTSTAVNCPIESWTWDFGDGSPPSTEPNPVHLFNNAGPEPVDYTVTLTVASDAGSNSATVVITVEAAAP